MSLNMWFALSMILLFVMSGLLFFRRGIAAFIAKHPGLAKIVAIILIVILFVLSLMPILVFLGLGPRISP